MYQNAFVCKIFVIQLCVFFIRPHVSYFRVESTDPRLPYALNPNVLFLYRKCHSRAYRCLSLCAGLLHIRSTYCLTVDVFFFLLRQYFTKLGNSSTRKAYKNTASQNLLPNGFRAYFSRHFLRPSEHHSATNASLLQPSHKC